MQQSVVLMLDGDMGKAR